MNKIWVVKTAEPLPCDEGARLLRMGLVSQELVKNNNNEIIWWSSTFDHYRKNVRSNHDEYIEIKDNYHLKLIHLDISYNSNLSPKRLLQQYYEGRKFLELSEKEEQPDIIICPMPTLEMAHFASIYAKKNDIPLVIDIRDLFPDMFIDFVPRKMRTFVKLGIIPYRIMLKKALRQATYLIATSDYFLEWGLKYAKREKKVGDRVYYVSYPDNNIELCDEDIDIWYKEYDLNEDDFICCFFGKFGYTVDLECVMRAAKITSVEEPKIKFVICGEGEKLSVYKDILGETGNVIFPGWVNRKQICSLGRISKVGLLAYKPGENYEYSMPNKFCEYLALGLALLVEPKGMMLRYVDESKCGMHFSTSEELADCIIKMYRDIHMVETMKRNARKLYESKFCAENVYKQYAEHIENILIEEKRNSMKG